MHIMNDSRKFEHNKVTLFFCIKKIWFQINGPTFSLIKQPKSSRETTSKSEKVTTYWCSQNQINNFVCKSQQDILLFQLQGVGLDKKISTTYVLFNSLGSFRLQQNTCLQIWIQISKNLCARWLIGTVPFKSSSKLYFNRPY